MAHATLRRSQTLLQRTFSRLSLRHNLMPSRNGRRGSIGGSEPAEGRRLVEWRDVDD